MKKIFFVCSAILVSNLCFAQNKSLFDVNYDAPKEIKSFDQEQYEFQKIYLQYEEALKNVAESIKAEEKSIYEEKLAKVKSEYQSELENAKLTEQQRANNTIEQARNEIYASEIQNVRAEETERLTQEITAKLTKELTGKISLEYENKKNQELAELEKTLRKQIYMENKTTTTRVKDISFAAAVVIIFVLAVIIIFLILKNIKIKLSDSEKNKTQIEFLKNKYSEKLKTLQGQSQSILAEIEKMKGQEKKNAKIAYEEAKALYEKSISLKDCEKTLSELDEKYKSIYKFCIQNTSDSDFIKSQCKEFEVNINNFNKFATEVFSASNGILDNEKQKFINHHFDLENFSTQIEGISVSDGELKKMLLKVSKGYRDCAKTFEKGKV